MDRLALTGLGVTSEFAVASFFVLRGERLPGSMLVTSAGLTSPGVIMIIFDGLESGLLIQDEIDCLSEFIVDDIEDFKQQRLTATHGMLLITALTLFGHILTLFPFRKWQAYWLQGLSMVAVATTILWVIMFLIALRELLCRRVDQPAQT